MQITANGIQIEYEEYGPKDGPALILIRGQGSQLIHWPKELVQGFAERGYRTVIFDNRDVGLTQRFDLPGVSGKPEDILAAIEVGEVPKAAYTLDDMAQDVVGLMDALGIERAHVFGISMGGAVAQALAIDHTDRLITDTIVMTAARFQEDRSELVKSILAYPSTRAEYIENYVQEDAMWGSPGYPIPSDDVRAQAALAWDRGAEHEGRNRQILAVGSAEDRREALTQVDLPCLVIHGADDTLVPADAGREIAACIPNSELHVIDGMGHIVTPLLSPVLVEMVDEFIRRRCPK